jgi:transposase-like protein
MSTLSHVHQFFHAETCHAYLHALRWQDRPIQCPHCHSPEVRTWGTYHYRPGFRRYRCTRCRRTFVVGTPTTSSPQETRARPGP